MKQFSYIITDPEGIHARPAGLLVKEAAKYRSKITVECNGKSGDLKRIFSLMALGVKAGMQINISAEGDDEAEAAAAVEKCLKANLSRVGVL